MNPAAILVLISNLMEHIAVLESQLAKATEAQQDAPKD